jgi:hypothetical protein
LLAVAFITLPLIIEAAGNYYLAGKEDWGKA